MPTPLNPDVLSRAFLYLDVGDVPKAAGTCRTWNETLAIRTVEEELWLGLVRKYHPIVESITNLLPVDDEDAGADAAASRQRRRPAKKARVDASSLGSAVPAPSRSWRGQFQRRHMLTRTAAPPPRTFKPLSSYFFEVEVALFNVGPTLGDRMTALGGRRTAVGVISKVVEYASWHGIYENRIRLPVEFDELCRYGFESYQVTVVAYERSTGRQSGIYSEGGYDRDIMRNYYQFDSVPVKRLLAPPDVRLMLKSSAMITKRGCTARCDCVDDLPMFSPLPSCQHCKCEKKWQCFGRLYIDVDFELELDGESNGEFLTQDQILRVLQEELIFS